MPAGGSRSGMWRFAAAQVWFHGGGRRDYLILTRRGVGNQLQKQPRQWWVRSLAESGVEGQLDLRDAEDVAVLEKLLAAADPKAFAAPASP